MDKAQANSLMEVLTQKTFHVTKLATTGGFLRSGNTTLLIGVENSKLNKLLDTISKHHDNYKQTEKNDENMVIPDDAPHKDGAAVFVLNVEQYEKL